MNDKKLYALTDEQAQTIVESAHWFSSVSASMGNSATAHRFSDLAASLAPLDREAAVERMREAIYQDLNYGVHMEKGERKRHAQAALDALLQEQQHE